MLNGKRYTTINTDAGIKGDVSAYAYWIRSEDYVIKHSSKFKSKIEDNNLAEMAAIVNALDVVSKDEYFRSADKIVVNSDSLKSIKALETNYFNGIYKELGEIYIQIKEKIKAPIKFKHVHGHMNKRSKNYQSRHHINNWCDKAVRSHY